MIIPESIKPSDGSIVAIGAYGYDKSGTPDAGYVRIYQNSSGTWSQLGSDIHGSGWGDYSGYSVSLSDDGTIVAIGGWGNDGNGYEGGIGSTNIYKYESGSWNQLVKIKGESAGDYSGYSVSLSGDGTIVAISATENDGNGSSSGHVRIYQNVSGTWTQIGDDIDGEAAGDRFGYSVSLSNDGTIIAIGAPENDGIGGYYDPNAGHTRIYKYESGSWNQLGSEIDGESAGDRSGFSVSLSSDGTIVAIGAPYNSGESSHYSDGHVRIFQYSAGTWSQLGSDIDDGSGYSVSLSNDGTIVAIDSYNYGDSIYWRDRVGKTRFYQYSFASDSWSQLGSDIPGTGDSLASVSLSSDGGTAAIGSI